MPLERRRHLRHKVHSPAYASVGVGAGGVVLDATERGAAIETLSRLAPQSFVDLRLDLLETRGSAVTPARVAWFDEVGRAGLEFLNLTGESRRQLQQWLLLNTLLATENAGGLAETAQAAATATEEPRPAADRELQAVAEQALAAAGAHGAAIALADGEVIVCRATAGEIAPPPGTRLDMQSGISGACVRSGRWLRCDDPRLDPHVDRESCEALGINSVLAIPIGERGNILGLIEVFSRQPYAFKEAHCAAVQELAKEVARSLRPQPREAVAAAAAEPAPPAQPVPPLPQARAAAAPDPGAAPAPAESTEKPQATTAAPSPETKLGEGLELGSAVRQRIILLGLVAAFVLSGLWFALSRGGGDSRSVDAAEAASPVSQGQQQEDSAASNAGLAERPAAFPESLRELRRRAEAGDAEAEFELGAKYASGEDVGQDYADAVKWFTRAAEGGQVPAAATLGAYYWAGRGVAQDDISAYMWSAIAKDGGDEASKYRIAILRARMTAAEVAEAEQRAAHWLQTHSHSVVMRRTTQ